MPPPHVVILLATYQGASHLQAQLDSLSAQEYGSWSLIASDDGSTDGTLGILHRFAERVAPGQVRLIRGPGAGATQNFLSMLDLVPSGCMAAFCDQDDVWFPDKLSRAVTALSARPGAAHYAARTIIANSDLQPLAPSRRFLRPLGIRNALVQACMAGNTSVFNPEAVGLLRQAAPYARQADVISHDWWAYQVTAAFDARVIHDPQPALLYRQHERSEVGRNDTLTARVARLRKLLAGDFGRWIRANVDSLAPLAHLMPAESRQSLRHAEAMVTECGPRALQAMRRGGFYRQTRAATAALAWSSFSGALRQRPAITR